MSERYSETQKKITKESVFTAFMKLLGKKAFNEITVTEITKIAGVSRAAFYRNYATKEDILIFYLNGLFGELLNELQLLEDKSKLNRTTQFFLFFKKYNNFIEQLIKAELSHIFYEQLCIYMTDFFRNETVLLNSSPIYEKYFSQYIASGLLRILLEWVRNGMVESVEDITQFIFEVTGS